MLPRLLIAGCSALSLVGAGYWWGFHQRAVALPLQATLPGTPTTARKAVKSRPPVHVIETRVSTAAESKSTEPARAPAEDAEQDLEQDSPVESGNEQARAAEERRVLQATYVALDTRFAMQKQDRHWGAATEALLAQSLDAARERDDGVRVASTDCGSEVCKTVLVHAGEGGIQDFIRTFSAKRPPALEQHFRYEGERTIIYSIRRDDVINPED